MKLPPLLLAIRDKSGTLVRTVEIPDPRENHIRFYAEDYGAFGETAEAINHPHEQPLSQDRVDV